MLLRNYIAVCAMLLPTLLHAKIDLVTLPVRDQVQLTIYNAADLTLVRERRTLTLQKGINRLEFSWADTLIDPTSVYLEAPLHAGQVQLLEVSYPPHVQGSAIWTIDSKIAGKVPVDILFFTSGIHWQSFYRGTLSTDENNLHLQHYVRVDNHSGEDYLNAQTRVVVGKIHLLDQIAELARRSPPYGTPITVRPMMAEKRKAADLLLADEANGMRDMMPTYAGVAAPKQIIKEGLSEYFIYRIEGTESILDGWGKRLLSLDVADIPVQALYRYDEHRYSRATQRLLTFKNDKSHHLGEIPLPDGQVRLYRQLAEAQHFSYISAVSIAYIPVEQAVELALGTTQQVTVEPILLDYQTDNYSFDHRGNIAGFDRIQQWQLKLANNRELPVVVEVFQHTEHPYWDIQNPPTMSDNYEKIDVDTFKYRLTLPAYTKEYLFTYTLTLFEGDRQQGR